MCLTHPKPNRGEHNEDHGELDEVYHLNDSFAKIAVVLKPLKSQICHLISDALKIH